MLARVILLLAILELKSMRGSSYQHSSSPTPARASGPDLARDPESDVENGSRMKAGPSGERGESKIQNPKSKILAPLAVGFRLGAALRVAAYRQGWLKTSRLDRPVVSVGNLTVGGTGKTPLVKFLAESLLKRGRRPAILTRGYGRRNGLRTIALAPKSGRIADSREAGDEPALLARALPEVPIVVSADRYEAGRLAEDRFGADVHLLDDGFQHLALARDVDVVVLDITQEFSDRALLPAGGQREPCSALKRAHIAVLTRVELGDPSLLEQRVRQINPQARVFHSRTKFCSLVDAQSGRIYPSGAFEGERAHAFCGIGNPKAFFANLKSWGFSLVAEDSFRDHHVYSERDVARLLRRSKKSGAEVLVTTEKDAMNIPALFKDHRPILACVVQTELDEGQAFEEEVLARLKMAEARI